MSSTAHGGHHIVAFTTYVAVGLALFALTGLTIGISFIDLGGWNAVVAFGIAALKTALVAAVFMHLFYDRKIYLLVFLTAVVFLAVFIAFTMFDVLQRADLYDITARPIEQNAAMYEQPATPVEHAGQTADSVGSVSHDAP